MKNIIGTVKVISLDEEGIKLEHGYSIYSHHEYSCCEHHYLAFDSLEFSEIEGAIFNFKKPWFEKVENYGIRLLPINMHPIPVPGYGFNNGCYSHDLTLVLDYPGNTETFDVSECQDISDSDYL